MMVESVTTEDKRKALGELADEMFPNAQVSVTSAGVEISVGDMVIWLEDDGTWGATEDINDRALITILNDH